MEPLTSVVANPLTSGMISNLRSQIAGNILLPEEDGYEEARKICNGMINKKPALILQCKSTNDVVVAVAFAKQQNLVISIRGGGHNITGNAICDGGIMIDMSQMKRVLVDPEQMTAKAQTGATWGDFDKATQEFGLATTGGIVSTTGIAGLTLGGGVGWLVRKHGFSCDNLVEAEVVTAEGKVLIANINENADLFWGLRGGSGNFGVVTSLTYRLHPVSNVLGGMILHPMEAAKEVLRFYGEFTKTAPNELTLYVGLLHTPDGAHVIALIGCYSGNLEVGKEVLKPLREFGSPLADLIQEQPYSQMQTMLDAAMPHGNRYYWKAGFLKTLSDEAIDTILTHVHAVTSPFSVAILEYYAGASSNEPEGGTAYPHRQPEFDLVIASNWQNKGEDDKHISWARSFWSDMQVYSSHRAYANALGVEGKQRVREAYGENYDRLLQLKKKYDPQNLFRLNQNINPTE